MSYLFTVLILITGVSSMPQANADVWCNPAKSHPCGNGCARNGSKCTKNWSTSRVGINPDSGGKKHYEDKEVKLVKTPPKGE